MKKSIPPSVQRSREATALFFVSGLDLEHFFDFTSLERSLAKTPDDLSLTDVTSLRDLITGENDLRAIQELARRFPMLPTLIARIFGHPLQDPELALEFILHTHRANESLPVIPRITLTGVDYS